MDIWIGAAASGVFELLVVLQFYANPIQPPAFSLFCLFSLRSTLEELLLLDIMSFETSRAFLS
jgi:hypothetical protein